MLHYGRVNPPSYNLNRVTTKTAIFIGENDDLATFPDAKHLARVLPNVMRLKLLDFPGECLPHEFWKTVYDYFGFNFNIQVCNHIVVIISC
jgi:hypothetical protein